MSGFRSGWESKLSTKSSGIALAPCSIVVYCGDTRGLGHFRRNMAIASRLVREIPGSGVLLLTSVPADVFECPDGVDIVKLPALTKERDGSVKARKLGMEAEELKRLRVGIVDAVMREFSPDLMLVDHQPTGLWDELLPILRRARESHRAPCTVLGLRDILDDPRVTTRRWHRHGVYRSINQLYDAVLIYGSRKVFDTERHYRIDRRVSTSVAYCGYVCAADEFPQSGPSGHEVRTDGRKRVVIATGGGVDGYPTMKLCVDALRRLDPVLGIEAVCITGPLMGRDEIDDLRTQSSGLRLQVHRCVQQTQELFGAADLIVTMAGYNSVLEAVRMKKRTLLIPRTGPSAEQLIRSRILSDSGLVRTLAENERDPETLALRITESLAADPPTKTLPDMDGLSTVVRRLTDLLSVRQARIADASPRRAAGKGLT